MSLSFTSNTTFTLTHARYLASKVATDLKRIQRLYGLPSDNSIQQYEEEMVAFLKAGYLESVTYGFKRDGNHIEPTLKYTAQDLSGMGSDDDPGKIRPGADISRASFYSFLTYNSQWYKLTLKDQEDFENQLPFKRSSASAPGVNGYLSNDKTYTSGGQSLNRSTLKSY